LKAKDLRNAVLQLAVQGKLVPQNPEDEPASVLIEKIKAEKARLVKGKKIKKQKPLPVISEEEIPFEIPESWEWVRLGEIGNWSSGATPQKSNDAYYRNGTIPWLRTGDLTDDYINDIPIKITQRALNETSVKLNKPGSVLIAMYGATIGKIGILTYEATTNQACCACDLFFDTYNRYLFYFLLSQKENFKKRSEGGAQPNISKEKIVKYLFPLPPLEEQKRIVLKIEKIMPLIDEYDKLEQKLSKLEEDFPEKLKKSILQYAVQGKLIPQNPTDEPASILLKKIKAEKAQLIKDKKIKKQKPLPPITEEEKPFEIPENWEWVRLGNIIQLTSGQDKSTSDYNSNNIGVPYITGASNINNDSLIINRWIEKPTSIAYRNDLLITCKGTIGTTIILEEELVHIARQIMSIRACECLNIQYIKLFIDDYVQVLRAKAVSMIPGINRNDILNITFPLPPIKEQSRIFEKVNKLMTLSSIVSDEKKLKKYKKELVIPEEKSFEYETTNYTLNSTDLKVAEDEANNKSSKEQVIDFSFAARSDKEPAMSENMKERLKYHVKRAKEAKKLKE